MTRGFIKEDDQEIIPIVPPRAELPNNTPNYVTPRGKELLMEEKQALLNDIENIDISDQNERRNIVNHINAKLQLLNERINNAKVIDLHNQPKDKVRFGATITLRVNLTRKNANISNCRSR